MENKLFIALVVFFLSVYFYSCDKENNNVSYEGIYNCSVKSTTYFRVTSTDSIIDFSKVELSFDKINDTLYDVLENGKSNSTLVKIVNDSISEIPYNPVNYRRGIFFNDRKSLKYQIAFQSTTMSYFEDFIGQRK